MNYYSKSPQEIIREKEKREEQQSVKRKRSYTLQFVNIGILVLILAFFILGGPSKIKQQFSSGSTVLTKENYTPFNFKWNSYEFISKCADSECALKVIQNLNNGPIKVIQWSVKETGSGEPVYRESRIMPSARPQTNLYQSAGWRKP